MSRHIPHLYGEITNIQKRRDFVITIAERNKLRLPPSAEQLVGYMRQGMRILIDLADWEEAGMALVTVLGPPYEEGFKYGQEGRIVTLHWRHITTFWISKQGCHLDLFDPNILRT